MHPPSKQAALPCHYSQATKASDYTAKVTVTDLLPGTTYTYQVYIGGGSPRLIRPILGFWCPSLASIYLPGQPYTSTSYILLCPQAGHESLTP